MSRRRGRVAAADALAAVLTVLLAAPGARAGVVPQPGNLDPRIRTAAYEAGQVYVLNGVVGYQIDLQFDAGESFVGLAAGDIEGLSFVAQGNHLFLKPRAAAVRTNLTVITSRRQYQLEYAAGLPGAAAAQRDVMYAVRFTYPPPPVVAGASVERQLQAGAAGRVRNTDYWSCGAAVLKPVAAWDDGVQTHLDFGPRAEIPAIFVRNDDDTESLLNFSVEGEEVVVHRLARRLVLRRGGLTACIVNKGYAGSGDRLSSGTLAPQVRRERRGEGHDAAE